jgi:hypothetical protein
VRYFSRCAVDTFKRAFVDLFVGLLVGALPVLVFMPRLVVEAGACQDNGNGVKRVPASLRRRSCTRLFR